MQNGGEGMRSVQQGGTISVDVGPYDTSVDVKIAGSSDSSTFEVEPGKGVTIPVPPVPGGTLLFVTVGKGLRARVIVIEVISSFH
jgi:hypothetical protein